MSEQTKQQATISAQTKTSFRDKWVNNPDLAFAETVREGSDIFNWILNRTPMKRWGKPDELAGAAVFLSSEASSFVTGLVLVADGGMSIAI